MFKLSIILLAAGLSTRMKDSSGHHIDKLLTEHDGKSLLERAVELLQNLPCGEKIIITSQERSGLIGSVEGVKIIINPNPGEGQSGSVRLGVQNASGTHYLFLNSDQPMLTADDLIPIIDMARDNREYIIYPLVYGSPCSPAVFPRNFCSELTALKGDTGGRAVRDANPDWCLCFEPRYPGHFIDTDE